MMLHDSKLGDVLVFNFAFYMRIKAASCILHPFGAVTYKRRNMHMNCRGSTGMEADGMLPGGREWWQAALLTWLAHCICCDWWSFSSSISCLGRTKETSTLRFLLGALNTSTMVPLCYHRINKMVTSSFFKSCKSGSSMQSKFSGAPSSGVLQ